MIDKKRTTRRTANWSRLLLGLLLGAAAIFLAARELSWRDVAGEFTGIRPGWVVLAIGIAFAGQTVKAARWRLILSSEPNPPGMRTAWIFHLSGQLGNILVPGPAGDVGRIVVVGGRGQGRMFTLGTVALEKVVDLIAYGLLVVFLLAVAPLPDWIAGSALALAGLAVLGLVGLWAAIRYRVPLTELAVGFLNRLPRGWGKRGETGLRAAVASLRIDRTRTLLLVLATGLIWAASILINHVMAPAFGLALPLSAAALLLVALQAGVSTNLVPGTVGLFEFLCVETLALYGVPRDTAFTFGIVLHAAVLTPLVTAALLGALGGWRE